MIFVSAQPQPVQSATSEPTFQGLAELSDPVQSQQQPQQQPHITPTRKRILI